MHDLTKHMFAFCAAVLIAYGSLNAVTAVPAAASAQSLTVMATPELA